MSLDLFRVIGGLDIQADDLSSNINILQGSGAPGGDTAEQDAAPIGSLYLRTDQETDLLQLYYKQATSNNSSADWRQAASKEYVDAVAQGISWRAPVRVLDDTLYADSSAFPTTGVIDSVALVNGDEVLFTNVTNSTEENIWVWSAGTTSWSESVNNESDGDATLIKEGSSAETQWVYDGAQWVQFGSAAGNEELAFLRQFIGKTGPGAENPSYSSAFNITNGNNLETAIGDLDAAIGDLSYTNQNVITDGQTVGQSLDAVDTAIGDLAYTNESVVTDGQTVTESIDALDVAVGDIINQTEEVIGTNISAVTPITADTLPLSGATQVKWMIQVRENGTPANVRALEIHALSNGTTLVDWTRYATLKLGANIAGFNVAVDINGTDLRLRLSANNNIDYVVKRIGYAAF